MATKSMMKKTSSHTKTQEPIEVKKEEVKDIKHFNKEDEIPCKSMTLGTLIMTGIKSKEDYIWSGYGDITDVQYQDLTALVNRQSEYIFSPYFVIEDEDFIEEFPKLKTFYENQITTSDLEDILALNERDMIKAINNLPIKAKETLKSIAGIQVSSGAIDSISKIRALDEYFGTELNLLQGLIS